MSRNHYQRYRHNRELGMSRRAAWYSALPTKVLACHAVIQGRAVIYRATIGRDPMILCDATTNVGLFMADTTLRAKRHGLDYRRLAALLRRRTSDCGRRDLPGTRGRAMSGWEEALERLPKLNAPDAAGQWHQWITVEDAAALSGSSTAPLDEAWREAEAALPEGGRLHLQQRAGEETVEMEDGQTWVARQGRPAGAYEAWATNRSVSLGFAYGDSPVAVLRALAARLAASPDPAQPDRAAVEGVG
jgi:hypothetical protein